MRGAGAEYVWTTDGLTHDGNHRGMPYYVFTLCGRFVSLMGVGHPEARQRGAEAGTVAAATAMNCIACATGIDQTGKGWSR